MKFTDDQLKQIIKEEVMANEGLMDFLRDPTGRKARAKIADLEKEIDNLLQYLTIKKQEEEDDFGFSKETEESYL